MDNQIFNYQNSDFQKPPKAGLPILRIIFFIFAAVIAFELLMGAKTLLTPIKVIQKTPSTVVLSEGVINLSTLQSSYGVSETVPVAVKVSTGNHLTSGVDLVLKYDPVILEASSAALIKG